MCIHMYECAVLQLYLLTEKLLRNAGFLMWLVGPIQREDQ